MYRGNEMKYFSLVHPEELDLLYMFTLSPLSIGIERKYKRIKELIVENHNSEKKRLLH